MQNKKKTEEEATRKALIKEIKKNYDKKVESGTNREITYKK